MTIDGESLDEPTFRGFGSPEDLFAVPVRLRERTLTYRWPDDVPGMTDDAAAAMSILCFLPVVDPDVSGGADVSVEWPISDRTVAAFRGLGGGISISSSVDSGVHEPDSSVRALAYGGGIDSRAAMELFPDALAMHEAPLSVREGRISSAVIERLVDPSRVVYTNQRELFDLWGLGSWAAVFAASLVVRPSSVVTGVNPLDSTYLGFNKGVPMRERHSMWYDFMHDLGIRIITTDYLSELANAKVVVSAGANKQVAYCPRIPFADCGQCAKCMRRRTLFALADAESFSSSLSTMQPNDGALAHLEERPLRWAHIYALAVERGIAPPWMRSRVDDAVKSLIGRVDFQERYLRSGMSDTGISAKEQFQVEAVLARHGIEPMRTADIDQLRRLAPSS